MPAPALLLACAARGAACGTSFVNNTIMQCGGGSWFTNTSGWEECCAACTAASNCTHWVHVPKVHNGKGTCHLKAGAIDCEPTTSPGSQSGVKATPAPAPTPAPPPPGPPPRPHILFLIADEMDGRILDDETPQFKPPMPVLRGLMADGAYFPRAYAGSPQCVPSRTSMMAGRYNTRIKVWDNFLGAVAVGGDPSKPDAHCVSSFSEAECRAFAEAQDVNGTLVDALAAAGYGINLHGKMHVGGGLDQYPGTINAFPFTAGSAKAAKEWSRATAITPTQGVPKLNAPDDVKAPATQNDYNAIDACTQLLSGGLFRSSVPQFLYCSILVPHPPYQSNSTYMSKVPTLGNFSVPAWRAKDRVHPADEYTSKVKNMWRTDEQDPAVVDHFRRVYFSMCVEADELFGRVLASMRSGGGGDQAYVIMVSDHGEHATENRQAGKNSMLEAAERVPFIVVGPGVPKGTRVRDLASLNDIYPTVLDMAGLVPQIDGLSGESLLPVAKGAARQKDYVIAEYHSVFSLTGTFMVRHGDLKLILYAPVQPGDQPLPPQLFNLSSDPWERDNVAESQPADADRLRALLAAEMDLVQADAAKKEWEKQMFVKYWYTPQGGAAKCPTFMAKVYGSGFDAVNDSAKVAAWLGKPCGTAAAE